MMGHAEMMGEKNPHPGVAEMSDEQRADLAALRLGSMDDQGAVTGDIPVTGPSVDLAGELAGLIGILVAVTKRLFLRWRESTRLKQSGKLPGL